MRSFRRALLDRATAPYRAAGRFAWHFSRSKLRRDPVFFGLLEQGVLHDASRLVDLGCGQGLLASWLRAARAQFQAGPWPAGWPVPPEIERIVGLELMAMDVERARRAKLERADFELGDMRTFAHGPADIFVILDVLHYLDFDEQIAVLRRIRAALPDGGLLVTRVGNQGSGWRFLFSGGVDHAVNFARGHGMARLHCRPVAEWSAMLARLGFAVTAVPMCRGTPFANVLLTARAA